MLEACRMFDKEIRLYHAGSSECFGDTGNQPATENTLFKPLSPYAVAKACSTNLVSSYRKSYNLFCCTGILFNHESPIRSSRFVTKKIVEAAYKVKIGAIHSIQLGNIEIYRDWGWSPDYVKAMHLMLRQDEPLDFLIATGKSVSLAEFIDMAFSYFNLNWANHVVIESDLMRPSDIKYSAGDPTLANSTLSLDSFHKVEAVIEMMCSHLENSGI
jgi:GDPmannose 4,6-dehydratase